MNKKEKECNLSAANFAVSFDRDEHRFKLKVNDAEDKCFELLPGRVRLADGSERSFKEADPSDVEVKIWEKGRGAGIDVIYRNFADVDFITRLWLPANRREVKAEWIPLEEREGRGPRSERIIWPVPKLLDSGYTVLPYRQGELIPRDWGAEIKNIVFDGQFNTAVSYMPWIGQVASDGQGWQMIAETSWDGGYSLTHPAGGPTEEIYFYWLRSLGRWSDKQVCRLYFEASGDDYNRQAKRYRRYVKENGHFVSLKEKADRNPTVKKLIGASVVHMGIKSHVEEDSSFYDPEHPEKNEALKTFAEREDEIKELIDLGADKFYLHLDGWAEPGYDNQHPDILPIGKDAGGPEGLRSLFNTVQSSGNLIGLHDQYRDYYFKAKSFSRDEAVTLEDGSNPEHARWHGGRQTYLCSILAPDYLKRNFAEIFKENLRPDCSYLDVFTCNEPDECFHPDHRATRKDCLLAREACFAWLNSQGIVPSSEEAADWAMREIVFAHYGPHDFMVARPGAPRLGIPVPLFNLVYHDAMMLPWPMEKADDQHEDYMLYALLNAGMPYLIREGAYPGVDGVFDDEASHTEALKEKIERARVVQKLQGKLAYCELKEHRFLDESGKKQEAVYSDGTVVKIDTEKNRYEICEA